MHRWQANTLARAEFYTHRPHSELKDLLYRIGLRHFPEPEVWSDPRAAGTPAEAVTIAWVMDGYAVLIRDDGPTRPQSPGGLSYEFAAPATEKAIDSGGIDPTYADQIRWLTGLILFGSPNRPSSRNSHADG